MATEKKPAEAGEKKFGRVLTTILVDGVKVRPRDAVFVVYDPQGEVEGTLSSDLRTRDSIASAARSYWHGESEALEKLNDGYHIKLTTLKALLNSAKKSK